MNCSHERFPHLILKKYTVDPNVELMRPREADKYKQSKVKKHVGLLESTCTTCHQATDQMRRRIFSKQVSMNCSNQTAWRKANLACKLAIDNMEKDMLLCGGENQSTRQRQVQFC